MTDEADLHQLFEAQRHLVVLCTACNWCMRCTPAEACEIFGAKTTVEAAWRMVKTCPRCGASGIGGDCKIDVRPCMGDFYAEHRLSRAKRDLENAPNDRTAISSYQYAERDWQRRRPREHGSFEIRLTPAHVGRPANSARFTFRGSSFRAQAFHA